MSSSSPEVSIIMPTIRAGPFLQRALSSVVAQSFTNWEVIIIDDSRSNLVEKSCQSFLKVWPDKAIFIRTEQHNLKGVSAARNCGINVARGSYLAFLDEDDYWQPQKLEKQLEVMNSADQSVVGCHTGVSIVIEEALRESIYCLTNNDPLFLVDINFNNIHTESYEAKGTFYLEQFNYICCSSVLARRETVNSVGRFDLSMDNCEDWALWLTLSNLGSFRFIREKLTSYRIHDASCTYGAFLTKAQSKEPLINAVRASAAARLAAR